MSPGASLHALSFDVEEFFQVANLRSHYQKADWDAVPSRLDVGMDQILACLDRRGARATMFFLGWVAERRPDLVRRCMDAGHEIASHGYDHDFLHDLGPEGVEQDLAKTEELLMAAGAPRPVGFRASTFTLTKKTFWATEILKRRGYEYDSSIHPIRHPTYGIPDFEPGISTIETEHGPLVEFPVSTLRAMGRNWPMGGGGYFRLLPGGVTRAAVARLAKQGRPASIYLHPWEFDPEQPRVATSAFKRFRHYVNLDRTLERLDALLSQHRFVGLREVLVSRGALSERRAS